MNWEEFEDEIKELAAKIDIAPDFIIGVVRGGLVPARLLAREIKVKMMFGVSIDRSEDRSDPTRAVQPLPPYDYDGKSVLLVEDSLESGQSLQAAKEALEACGALVTTACLYTLACTEVTPDYSLGQVLKIPTFPWE